MQYFVVFFCFLFGCSDDEICNGKGQYADNQTDAGVEDNVLGLFSFTWVASGGHIADAPINDHDDSNDAEHADDGLNDVADYSFRFFEVLIGITTGGDFDIFWNAR